jgi:hypothetical protein
MVDGYSGFKVLIGMSANGVWLGEVPKTITNINLNLVIYRSNPSIIL